jgi:hypothetical protein
MRGSLRAEEPMEATGMLAQRFERSAAVERLKRLELLPPACCLLPRPGWLFLINRECRR